MATVLVTGGTGFIGSHIAVELLDAGYDVILADNFSNSEAAVAHRVEQITGKQPLLYQADLTEYAAVERIFSENCIEAVIHCAGYKAVGRSVQQPLQYYRNNLDTAMTVLEAMQRHDVTRFVFSSSATVYGADASIPYTEAAPTGDCTNPYGWTKYMIEQILRDIAAADPRFSAMLLRYFNPIGAHESGLIGERPTGIPDNLMPYITQVAFGKRPVLSIFGDDYPTPDGTGVRDYIHVTDLAKGHIAALRYAEVHTGVETVNLGTGCGHSVLEVVHTFEMVNGVKIPYCIGPRRAGDVAVCYADTAKAKKILGWQTERTLEDMCRDSWRWQKHCCEPEREDE